ncbi:hypothetical protein EJB05_29464, partial [Eragrostis curvula]
PPTAIRSWHPTRNYRTEVTEIIVCSGDHQVRLAQVFVPHGLVSRRSSHEALLWSGTLGSQRPIPVNSICSYAQNRALLGSNGVMSSFYCPLFDVILLRVSNLCLTESFTTSAPDLQATWWGRWEVLLRKKSGSC